METQGIRVQCIIVPTEGEVELVAEQARQGCGFKVRGIEYRKLDGKWERVSSRALMFGKEMQGQDRSSCDAVMCMNEF